MTQDHLVISKTFGKLFFLFNKNVNNNTTLTGVAQWGWVSSCKPKSRQFNSWSGHMPGLQARPPVGHLHATGNQLVFFSSLSLPLSL